MAEERAHLWKNSKNKFIQRLLIFLIILIISKVGDMDSLEQIQAQKMNDDDYFDIIFNYRRVERARRKKLLKKHRLQVEEQLRAQNSKLSEKRREKMKETGQTKDEEPFLWDVLNQDCLNFKFDFDFFSKEDSVWIQSQKTEESSTESTKQEPKKTLFMNEFVQFRFELC